MEQSPPVALIAGPTASGKSAFAMALAERVDATIINADSMQVYSELQVLTARPSSADEARVPHLNYGHVPAREAYSAGRFAEDAIGALASCRKAGRAAIFVGGTGLYFNVLTQGLSPIPPIPDAVRARWRAFADAASPGELASELRARDPVMAARLVATDRQRLVRALEVIDATGRSLAQWQAEPGQPVVPAHAIKARIVVTRDREALHARADQRFQEMVRSGALDEVAALMTLDLDPQVPAIRALGVRALAAHLSGKIGLEAAIAAGQAETRQYIKRQLTWLRRYMIAWDCLDFSDLEISQALEASFVRDAVDALRPHR